MRQSAVRRKLQDAQTRISHLRGELAVIDEQLEALAAEAEDLRVRALVSETPLAAKEHAEAARHAELARRARSSTELQIVRLEGERDRLLEMVGASS